MALDTLDFAVLFALAVAVVAYFAKDQIFGSGNANEKGFLSNTGSSGSSRDLVEVLKKNNKNTVLFYGSQTGTAEDYASKLLKELASRFGLKCLTADLADYDYDTLDTISNDVLVFFLMATYGEGEPTDNAVEFYDYLQNDADQLATLKYTVFGLGNSTYEFYNAIGKNVFEKLESLGSESFAPYGEGDDGKGTMDEDFLAWKEKVFDALKNDLNFEEHDLTYEPAIEIIPMDKDVNDETVSYGEPSAKYLDPTYNASRGPFDHSHPYIAPIATTTELFHSKDRSCVHAEFDISGSNLRYSTGDHLAIWPSNSDENIKLFAKAFNVESKLNDVFKIKALDSTYSIPFHTPITYGAVIRHHLEISGAISRQFLSSIANFSPSPEIKKEVTKLANDKLLFAKEVTSQQLDVADLLLKLSNGQPWTQIPFEFVIETIPHLQARYYSISSSSLTEKTSIHVTAVVEAETHHNKKVGGVVTNLLKNLEIEQNNEKSEPFLHYDLKGPRGKFSNFKLPVHVRRSTFKLPSNPSIPIILIGPGTGIAPMRGFVRERVTLKKNDPSVTIGETFVFYGCRTRDEDYLYKNEWPEYAKALGDSFQMEVAFSREDPTKKVYVQDKLLAHQLKLNELLDKGAYIYVCGDASRMARDVQKTLGSILAKGRNITEEKAAELIRSFKVQNRYQEDVW
ncbi:NADPH-cytochrome P450 reductase [Scheffersomyces spartinae]|uniref:NADPH--cytochrome P450 reductase n=1 Tax=Scheffersomyces spartinae TaxID=45513 RepID=A0A9P7VED8_9ASCO|nr:NADPH-cytochrome P450 reductase [Scheffersomyces spartinae]KAG7195908.1 NADPH-cytochrome P450 reductase [Scheffersomyces spartinae]